MPEFVIEREIPDLGNWSQDDLRAASQKSCSVLSELGPKIQWIQSFVTQNKLYCIYSAPDESFIREHAKRGGFPANHVNQVHTIINPATAAS